MYPDSVPSFSMPRVMLSSQRLCPNSWSCCVVFTETPCSSLRDAAFARASGEGILYALVELQSRRPMREESDREHPVRGVGLSTVHFPHRALPPRPCCYRFPRCRAPRALALGPMHQLCRPICSMHAHTADTGRARDAVMARSPTNSFPRRKPFRERRISDPCWLDPFAQHGTPR